MKYNLFFRTLILILGLSFQAQAQPSPDDHLQRFFRGYERSPLKAVDFIFSLNPIFEKDALPQALNVREKLEALLPKLGTYYGNELIVKKEITRSLFVFSFIVKYEYQPIRFIFKFYRPDRNWLLLGFSYDDSLSREMEEAVRLPNIFQNNEGGNE